MIRIGRHHGFVLLPVVLAITLIAVIAFMLNNQSAINVDVTAGVTDAVKAENVARAGLAHATWGAQNSGCAGDMGMTTVPFGLAATDNYTAAVTTPGGATTAYPDLASDQDAWFRSDNITTNNGTSTSYHLRMESGNLEYAVVRFDLSTLPAGAQINSAVAQFFVVGGKGHPEGPVTVHRVTADWTETGATWETLSDKYDSAVLATIPAQPAAGDVRITVNLTAQVQAWVNGGQPNYGIMLIPTGEGTHAEYISREGAATEQPGLDVIVGSGPATPATITATGTMTGNPSPANDITRTLTRTDVPAYQPPGTRVLQPGPEGKDAMIYQWKADWNYGSAGSLYVRDWGSDSDYYSLLQFDLGSIPHGAAIHSAELALYQNTTSTAGGSVDAYRITSDWVEGSGNGGTAPGVTWNERDTGVAWTTPGGDLATEAVASTAIPVGTSGWFTWDITGLVSGWVSGIFPNQGLALVHGSNNAHAIFESSDATDPTLHPRLTVSYACECGRACLAPQGKGNVLMVVVNPTTLVPADAEKKALFESWGYTVNVISESANQGTFDAAATANDVVYVSNTVNSNTLGGKLANLPIGVVSEDGDYNPDLGFAADAAWTVGSAVNVTDTSHYITAPFAAGPLEIYSGGMEQLTVSGTEGPGLQTLADTGGAGSLVVLDKGADMAGGGTTAGRRVMLPLGRDTKFNWDYLNANGRLLVQRALQWGTGNVGAPPKNLLLVVVDPGNLTAQEAAKKTLIESWDYTVNLIDESDSQANFDDAIAANDVAYIPTSIDSAKLGTKLVNATIGVVNENMQLATTFGFASDYQTKSRNEIRVTDNTHYITSPLATGYLTIFTTLQNMYQRASTSGAETTLADSFNVGSDSNNKPSLITLNPGDALDGGGTAAGRRVQLPWGDNTFDVAALNADGLTIMQRAIEWAEGAGPTPAPTYNVLLVVGDAVTLSSKDTGYKALMESWGHTVTLIDDGDSQANFDAAAAANDVVYVSGSSSGPSVQDKLTNTPTGLVNEVNGKLDNFGFSSSTASTANFDTFSITNAAHYITEPFSGNPVTVFTASLTNPVPGGTLAPDLSNVGEVTGTPSLVTLDAGATRYDSNPSQGRRAHLPFTAAETTDMTADGQTILQRTLEWAAGAGAGTATLPIAHWKFDEGTGPTAFDSVGSNDATLNGSPAWTTGTINGALDFDGSSDYVTTDNNFTPPPIGTVTFWMQVSGSPAAHGRILGLGDAWEIRHVTTGTPDGIPYGLVFDLGLTGVNTEFVTTTTIDTPGQWYHIAASYDTTNDAYAVYIDGVPHKSGTYPSALAVPAASLLSIGTRTGSTNYFDGMLDDVRVYDEFLSAAEIAYLAAGGGGGGGGGGGSSCDSSGNYLDQFDAQAWDGSNGSIAWTTQWAEVGESDGAGGGDVRVDNDISNYQLYIQDNQNGGEGVEREADLSGAATATLSLEYRRNGLDNANDYVAVYASSTGTAGPWTELTRFQGSGTDSVYQPYSVDISAYISANTAIRLRSSTNNGNTDRVWFENIEITCAP